MKDKSALRVLPTFKRQITDTNCIFAIMSFVMFGGNFYLYLESHSLLTICMTIFSIIVGTFGIVSFFLFFKKQLRNRDSDFYISITIEYILLCIGYFPLFLYLFVEQHWGMLDRFGIDCLFLYNKFTNWLLPLSVFAMISITYWIIMNLAYKESTMFYLLEKKKKEIYE